MNPLNTVTDAVTLPARAAGHVAAATLGATVGAATVGLRATGRAMGWALDRAAGAPPHPAASPWPVDTTTVVRPEPVPELVSPEPAPVTKAPAKRKAPAKKKAPTKQAAVLAPALGVPESEVLDGTVDLDPA